MDELEQVFSMLMCYHVNHLCIWHEVVFFIALAVLVVPPQLCQLSNPINFPDFYVRCTYAQNEVTHNCQGFNIWVSCSRLEYLIVFYCYFNRQADLLIIPVITTSFCVLEDFGAIRNCWMSQARVN